MHYIPFTFYDTQAALVDSFFTKMGLEASRKQNDDRESLSKHYFPFMCAVVVQSV